MSDHQVIPSGDESTCVRVTIATVEIAGVPQEGTTTSHALCDVVARLELTPRPRPARASLHCWSPWQPFAGMAENYRLCRQTLHRGGAIGIIVLCVVAGLAATVWPHDTIVIGVAGGLLVSGILFVRTDAYREYLAAIEEIHGIPPLGAVLRYNAEDLLQRIRILWRR